MSLSGRLILREREQQDFADAMAVATGLRETRQANWQGLEAQVRHGEDTSRRLKRRIARRVDEKAIGEAADRTTRDWCRP
jgi:hypothetical protein